MIMAGMHTSMCAVMGQVWSTKSVEGVHRFLARAYRLVTGGNLTDAEPSRDQLRLLHTTIKRVGQLATCMMLLI